MDGSQSALLDLLQEPLCHRIGSGGGDAGGSVITEEGGHGSLSVSPSSAAIGLYSTVISLCFTSFPSLSFPPSLLFAFIRRIRCADDRPEPDPPAQTRLDPGGGGGDGSVSQISLLLSVSL